MKRYGSKKQDDINGNTRLRMRAEEIACETLADLSVHPETIPPKEVLRTLHELQIHQIELQLQNDELRRTHTELETLKSRYFDLFDLAPVGYCTISPEGQILEANFTACGLLGATRAELVGKPFSGFVLPQDRDSFYVLRKLLLDRETTQECELQMVRKSGVVFWAHLSGTATDGAEGSTVYRIVLSDITARRQIEIQKETALQALHESEEKFRILFHDSPDAYLILANGVFIDCNRAAEVMLGWDRSQIIGNTPASISPELQPNGRKSSETAAELINTTMLNGNTTFDWVHRRMDGSDLIIEISISLMQLAGKNVLFTTWRDISVRKRAEASLHESEQRYRLLAENNIDMVWKLGVEISEREQAQAALLESERRYRLLAENTTDVIWILDPENKSFLYISPSVEQMLGFTPDEMMSLDFAEILDPKMRESFLVTTRQRAENFRVQTTKPRVGYVDEVILLRKDGFPIWAEIVNNYYQEKTTGRVEIQGVSRDITRRKFLEMELQQQATTDDLTEVFNRRHFLNLAQSEQKRGSRFKHPFAIALIDLDHFKMINDTYGHLAGDQALITFTKRCQENIREIDILARFGGDEFVMLLPETTCEQAHLVVERVHLSVTSSPFVLGGIPVPVTLSAGLACSRMGCETLDDLLIRADQALYKVKETGRNKIGVNSPETDLQ